MSLEELARPRQRAKRGSVSPENKRAQAADRKRRQRAAESAATRFEPGKAGQVLVKLTAVETRYLEQALRVRALCVPTDYSLQEYLSTLILRDGERLAREMAETPPCRKCGLRLPDSCERVHRGEADCMLTSARELML